MYSILDDRLLRYDGVSIVEPDKIGDMLLGGLKQSQIVVTDLTDEIKEFNNISYKDPIKEYDGSDVKLDFTWQVPKEFLEIDLLDYFAGFMTEYNAERIAEELEMVMKMDVENQIRTIIYVIDELKKQKVVWGIGRGSSCASYLLFLIGVHQVDCIKYNIPYTEFFHE